MKSLPVSESSAGEHRRCRVNRVMVLLTPGTICRTFLFLFMSFGIATIAGQQANTASSAGQVQGSGAGSTGSSIDPSQLMYSSLGFGFS